jgi:aminoglycoside phosphotransferase
MTSVVPPPDPQVPATVVMKAGAPPPGLPVPAPVAAEAGAEPVRAVWANDLGGATFEIGTGARRRFVKWAPAGSGIDLAAEAARMSWAAAFTPVPRLLAHAADNSGSWLVSSALPGEMAVTDRWRARPHVAVAAIGAGLRAMHDALPVSRCPFSWDTGGRLSEIRERAASGMLDPAGWHPDHQDLSVEAALELLAGLPPVDELVVCHGDGCAPNTLITDDGRCSGHVDLGALGVADRWADLAVATWSTIWNYGPEWQIPLLDAYGIAPDPPPHPLLPAALGPGRLARYCGRRSP